MRRRHRLAAALGALALAAFASLTVIGPATAAPIGDPGNIDSPDAGTGEIVVHKYVSDSTNGTTAGDGTATPPTGTVIPGVEFTVKEVLLTGVALDLLTNAGWESANDIEGLFDADNAERSLTVQAGVTLSAGTIQVTNGSGTATFGSLTYGLYLVQETDGPATITDPAKPFLITIPFPTGPSNATNPNEWLYSVHVYPKNAVAGLDKVVNSGDAGFFTAGDYVKPTVTVDLPLLPSGDNFTNVVLTDTINTSDLAFVTDGYPGRNLAALGRGPRRSGCPDGDNVRRDHSLRVQHHGRHSDGDVHRCGSHAARVAGSGREPVRFIVPTKIVTLPASGIVTNNINSVVNDSDLDADATQGFGQLRVLKYAETDLAGTPTNVPLVGATFQLFHDLNNDGVLDVGEPQVVVDGASEWISGSNGELDIEALKPGNYLLVETVAPAGYQVLGTANPIDVTVVVGETVVGSADYSAVENLQLPPFSLPFTGSTGALTFGIAGATLTALGVALALIARRRRARA